MSTASEVAKLFCETTVSSSVASLAPFQAFHSILGLKSFDVTLAVQA